MIVSFSTEQSRKDWAIAFIGRSFQLKTAAAGLEAAGKGFNTKGQAENFFASTNAGIGAISSQLADSATVADKRAVASLAGWTASGMTGAGADGKTMVQSDGELELGPELAKGNFGTVYSGTWGVDKRAVAIKVLNVPDDDEAAAEVAEEFQQEVEMCCRIHHPCVVEFLGYLTEPRLIIVAELVPRGCASQGSRGVRRLAAGFRV